jgi:predicted nucleic acid-binding protein
LIVCDTSAILVLVNRQDRDHVRFRATAEEAGGPYIVPAATIGKIAYFIESRMTPLVMEAFLLDLEARRFDLDCGESDFARIRHLVRRYADLRLGLVDAAVITCAERRGSPVLTLDRRHFDVVAREGTITVLR